MTVIAEALAERRDLVRKIAELDDQIAAAAVVEERDTPASTTVVTNVAIEKTKKLIGELNSSLAALETLENRIRARNSEVKLPTGKTLSEAIVLRDRLKTEFNAWAKIAKVIEEATGHNRATWRYGGLRNKDEIRLVSALPAGDAQSFRDQVAKSIRELDNEIQKVNWAIEI